MTFWLTAAIVGDMTHKEFVTTLTDLFGPKQANAKVCLGLSQASLSRMMRGKQRIPGYLAQLVRALVAEPSLIPYLASTGADETLAKPVMATKRRTRLGNNHA